MSLMPLTGDFHGPGHACNTEAVPCGECGHVGVPVLEVVMMYGIDKHQRARSCGQHFILS